MQISTVFLRLALATLLLLPLSAVAGELRIVDSMGLTRAVKTIDGSASVTINAKVHENPSQVADVILAHVDGLAADIEGVRGTNNLITFPDVGEGVWKIKPLEPNIVISEVKIVQ